MTGGAKVEEYLRTTAAKVSNPGTLRVGFLEGATYPDGTSVAMIAAIQNFGAPSRGIPPRPFFSNMIAQNSPSWPEQLDNLLKLNDMDAKKSLHMMGEGISGQLRQSIVDTEIPSLSILTLLARKYRSDFPNLDFTASTLGYLAGQLKNGPPDVSGVSTKPLVDTGHMLGSVNYEVV